MEATKLGLFALVMVLLAISKAEGGFQPLKLGYYYRNKSCVNVESIVKKVVTGFVKNDSTLAASILRMHFHDCFVRGCDGSVLLNSTSNNVAEKDSFPNLSLRGFEVIDAVKSAVEAACPNKVSCADILALSARDAVEAVHGPSWLVPTGRRDGVVSISQEALTNLPPFFANFTTLKSMFASKGLNVIDLVALSGGHTIGVAHCSSIDARLYNFTGRGITDPSLNAAYATQLKQQCTQGDQVTKVPLDGSVGKFDTSYFQLLQQGRGLLESDAALLTNSRSKFLVDNSTMPSIFLPQFSKSMTKMGRIGVLTGSQGEIRKNCRFVN